MIITTWFVFLDFGSGLVRHGHPRTSADHPQTLIHNCDHHNHYSDLNASTATCPINTMSEHRDNVTKHLPFSSVMLPGSQPDQPFAKHVILTAFPPYLRGQHRNSLTCTGIVLVPVKPPELSFYQRTTAYHCRLHLTCHNALPSAKYSDHSDQSVTHLGQSNQKLQQLCRVLG